MGWRLVEEILDHCPDLKYREFRALIALAVDARDETRKAMPGAEVIARRARCRSRAAEYALASLREKGLIELASHSAPGRRAVYAIRPLTGTGANIGAGDTPANIRAPEKKNTGKHRRGRTPATMRAPTPAHIGADPPSYPSVTPSYTGAQTAPTAQAILAAFIDWDRASGGQLTKRTIGQLAKQISRLIGEGIDDRYIKQGLAEWRARGQHPSTLDSFVNAAMNGHQPKSRRQAETDAMAERWMARAEAREQAANPNVRGELE